MTVCFVGALALGHNNWERHALYHGLPMFFVGVMIFHFPKMPRTGLIQIAAITILIAALHFGWHNSIATLCFAALIVSTRADEGPSRLLAWPPLLALGHWSYSIYLLHIPVRYVLQFFLHLDPANTFFLAIVLTLALGAASYHFFEMPARAFLASSKSTGQLRRLKSVENH